MTIVYSMQERKPGCVLLQGVLGGTVENFSFRFPSECWLTAPTEDMRAYHISEDQLKKLVEYHGGKW